MKLSVVVPFYNELRTLPTVIDRLLKVDFSLGLETELIFVDDGSTDAGRSLLDPLPRDDVRVIVHPTNRGKGAAVKTGLEAATGDILCIQDADLEYDPRDLPALIEPILDGDYEVVYGSRFRGSAAGLYYTHRIANRLLNLMVNVAFNRYLSDVYTGYKVFTRQAYRGLRLTAKTFTVEMELTAHFLRKGLVIYEVPISYRARTYAEGKKIHFKDGFLAAGAVARYRSPPAGADRPGRPRRPRRAGGDARRRGRRHHPHPRPGGPGHRPPLPPLPARPARPLPGPVRARGRGRPRRLLRPAAGPRPPGRQRQRPDLRARPRRALRRAPRHRGPPADVLKLKVEPPVDSVVALNVLERMDDDVAALRAMARTTLRRPGPAGRARLPLAGAFDDALGHLRRYTPTASATPSRPPAWPPRSSARSTSSAARLVGRRPGRPPGLPHPALVRLYDRLVVPAERPPGAPPPAPLRPVDPLSPRSPSPRTSPGPATNARLSAVRPGWRCGGGQGAEVARP